MIQNLVVTRGKPFKEIFNLKKPDGTKTSGRGFNFYIVVYRKDYIKRFELANRGETLELKLTPEQTNDFDSNVLSYKIVAENETKEVIAQGMLRVE